MDNKKIVLYIGGFELPDKNAAAQRVVGVAKGLRDIGYKVIFLNSVRNYEDFGIIEKEYYGFKCFEYKRERKSDYLVIAKTVLNMIKKIKPNYIIAYNYPAISLNRIRKYCKKHEIKCYVDTTEWYEATKKNLLYTIIKNMDTTFRMRYVQNKVDGVIAISRYLYDYYKNSITTILIPPTVDIKDNKWDVESRKNTDGISFVYAGSPSIQKEKLDIIVNAIEQIKFLYKVKLNVVGITKEQFVNMYSWNEEISDNIVFWGRIEHNEVLKIIKRANWSIIMRENNRVVNAGFPTKLVESISCGTPVIVNCFSNITNYLDRSNSIVINNINDINNVLKKLYTISMSVDRKIFDYKNYEQELRILFK